MAYSSEYLISDGLVEFAQLVFDGAESSLPIYFNLYQGPVEIGGGLYGAQTIEALDIPLSTLEWSLAALRQIDDLIDLDFYFLDHNNGSLIDIYFDSEIVVDTDSIVLGLAVPNAVFSGPGEEPYEGYWWELILNAPMFQSADDQLRYALIHEFGHALGLEHPFDQDDGDHWGTEADGPNGDTTVMSYLPPPGGWPDFYSPLDRAALATIWGLEHDGPGQWRFREPDGSDSVLSTEAAQERLSLQLPNEQLLGPVAPSPPVLEPLQSLDAQHLLADGSFLASLSEQGVVFVAFSEAVSADKRLLQAYTNALALLDPLIELDFQFLTDPTSPLADLVLDRRALPPEKLDAGEWLPELSVITDVTALAQNESHHLKRQLHVNVDPFNPFYRNQDAYSGLQSYLDHAALQAVLLSLGLQFPLARAATTNTGQTLLAQRIDAAIVQPLLSDVDRQALQLLHGIEQVESPHLDAELPELSVESLSLLHRSTDDQVVLEAVIHRGGNTDVSAAALLHLYGQSYSDPDAGHQFVSTHRVAFAPDQLDALLQMEVPVSTWQNLEAVLADPYQSVIEPVTASLDLHHQLFALSVEPLVSQHYNDDTIGLLRLEDQGSEQVFIAIDDALDSFWRSSLDALLPLIDELIDLDFQLVNPDSPLAQWVFAGSDSGEPSRHVDRPSLVLGSEVYRSSVQTIFSLPVPDPQLNRSSLSWLSASLLQELLLAMGLERPTDATDGDHYDLTPVLPQDSALFTLPGPGEAPLLLQDIDQQALLQLYSLEDDPDAGYPLNGADSLITPPQIDVVLDDDRSGARHDSDDLQLQFQLTRSGNTQLNSVVVLSAWSADPLQGDPLWSEMVRFNAGESSQLVSWQASLPLSSNLIVRTHPLVAASTPDDDLILGVHDLDVLRHRSPATAAGSPPHGIGLSRSRFPESLQPGDLVAELRADDPDSTGSDSFYFTLVDGEGDAHNDAFRIDGDQLQLVRSIDYEAQSAVSLRIRITDADGHFRDQRLHFDVTDVWESALLVTLPSTSLAFSPGVSLELPLALEVSASHEPLQFDGLRLHFDSDVLMLSTPSGHVVSDQREDLDGDPTTDLRLEVPLAAMELSSLNNGEPLPLGLLRLEPVQSESRFDPLTGSPLESALNFSLHASSELPEMKAGQAVATVFNLDVDGDGVVTALGDGLMVIRKLFGAPFAGEALIRGAVNADEATRTSAEIHDFIQQGIDQGQLDVDGDGRTTALGDGLMIIRSLFGSAFSGSALISNALSLDSDLTQQQPHHAAMAIRNTINDLKAPNALL